MSEPTTQTPEVVPPREPSAQDGSGDARPADALIEQDLLVEDVSIDGMCGVY